MKPGDPCPIPECDGQVEPVPSGPRTIAEAYGAGGEAIDRNPTAYRCIQCPWGHADL